MPDAVADRLGDAFGLLVDLLEHERLVARPLRRGVVPVDLDHVVLDGCAGRGVADRDRARRDRDDLAVVRKLDATSLGQEGCEVRREEVLAVAEPDHHRRLVANADEMVRMVVVDDDEGEMALESPVRAPHRFDEVAVVRLLEQVRDHLGVGLRPEGVAGGEKLVAQLAVVLDDAVQDDREFRVGARLEWVRVLLGDAAVRRPACVAEPGRRLRAVRARLLLQDLEVADGARVLEPVLLEQDDPGGVIASVLEPFEPLDEQRLRRPVADVPDDPAHTEPPPQSGRLAATCPSKGPRKRKSPAPDRGPSVGIGQPSSRRTSAAMLAQASAATS